MSLHDSSRLMNLSMTEDHRALCKLAQIMSSPHVHPHRRFLFMYRLDFPFSLLFCNEYTASRHMHTILRTDRMA